MYKGNLPMTPYTGHLVEPVCPELSDVSVLAALMCCKLNAEDPAKETTLQNKLEARWCSARCVCIIPVVQMEPAPSVRVLHKTRWRLRVQQRLSITSVQHTRTANAWCPKSLLLEITAGFRLNLRAESRDQPFIGGTDKANLSRL